MRTSELAKAANIDSQTIRYYEKIGILGKPDRTESNYRNYDDSAIVRLKFIKRAKEIGFSLNDIKVLLDMSDGKITRCDQVREFAETRLMKIRNQIKHLKAIEKGLADLVKQCRFRKNIIECPIMKSLTRQ